MHDYRYMKTTSLLLIFAGLNFRDFRGFQKIAKLKTRENLFQTFSIVSIFYVNYVFLAQSRN